MAGVEANTVSTPIPLGGKFQPADARTVGDGDIIQATRQNTNPSGLTQFEITLPSGRRIESEWLREDQLKKALLPWIETIKAEMQADAEEVRAIARRAAVERSKPKAGPILVSPSGDALTAELDVPPLGTPLPRLPSTSSTAAAPTSASAANDPAAFARQGLEAAKQAERYWANEANKAAESWTKASQDLDKWERILAALGGQEASNEDSNSSNNSGSSNPVSGSDVRRRGRPAGSKNKPKLVTV